ncbi:MAG: carboxypeptidase-like regulatory domain-containing protein, partial [Patescibacteria group bacterium]
QAQAQEAAANVNENPQVKGQKIWKIAEYDYRDENSDGLWEAEIQAPMVAGKYVYSTYIEYQDPAKAVKEIQAETLIDPEGYVYTETADGYEKRLKGAIVSLWQFNPTEQTYKLWQAKEYSQVNPQLTRDQGEYAFLTPEGIYKLKAEAKGFKDFESDNLRAQEGQNIFFNIKMEAKAGLLAQSGLSNLIKILIIITLSLTIIFLIIKILKTKK